MYIAELKNQKTNKQHNVVCLQGDDAVTECVLLSNGTMVVKNSYNAGNTNIRLGDVSMSFFQLGTYILIFYLSFLYLCT